MSETEIKSLSTTREKAMLKAVGTVIRDYVSKRLEKLEGLLKQNDDDIRRRIAALEMGRKDVLRYRGVFSYGLQYYPGDVVTCKDTIWFCQGETNGTVQPGECPDWKLMVRRDPKIPKPGGAR
jgi:hypothetical protein